MSQTLLSDERITLRHVRRCAANGETIPMLTCYDATTARWLYRAGLRCLLVGDTAAQMILGHDSTLPATLPFMLEITAAVRRGAPNAFIMGDMPFGSYQCGDDQAVANAMAFLTQGQADVVKLEVDATFVPLVKRLSHAGVPVVAHLGSLPQHQRATGRHRKLFRNEQDVQATVAAAAGMIEAGACMLLLEAVPEIVAARVVELAAKADPIVPVIGCGAGDGCHGHVVVLHDLLGLTDWQPPFAHPQAALGEAITQAAKSWIKLLGSGDYLKNDHPYHLGK